MKSYLIFILLLLSKAVLAQLAEEKVLANARGIDRLPLLESASHKLENADVVKASRYAIEGISIARNSNLKEKEQELLGWLGFLMRLQIKYDSSANFYEQALLIAQERNDLIGQAEYLNGISQLERVQGMLSGAINHAVQARVLAEKAYDQKQIGEALYNIGYIHLTQRSYDSAMAYFKKSLHFRRQAGDSSLVAGSYNGIGLVHMRQRDYLISRSFYNKAASLIDSISQPRLLAMIYNNIGITYEDLGEFQKGRDYYYRSIEIKKRVGDKRGLASTYGNIGDNYRESKNADEALRFARLSKQLSEETQSLDYLITAHKIMAYAYEIKKDYKNAYESFQTFHNLQDSLFNSTKSRQVSDVLAHYHADKKHEENEKLKASAALNETVLSRQKIIIIGTAISLGGLLFALNFVYSLYNRSKKLTNDLTNQKAEAEKINAQLNIAIQDNQNITDFMVHDLRAPMNKVAGLTNLIQKEGALNHQQEEYAKKMLEVVNQGRKLIDDLLTVNKPRQIRIEPFDINNFLQDIIKEYISIAEQKNITVNYNLPDGSVAIESDEILLNRVMDNLISNAIKFSPKGSAIYITLQEKDESISIEVRDEGPGFTNEDKKSLYQKFKKLSATPTNGEPSNGLGLAIAKSIIDSLGGEISLATYPGHGSTFTVEIPKNSKA